MTRLSVVLLAVFAFAGTAFGQAIIEYGLGAGRAGVAGAGTGKNASKAIGAVLDKTTKAVDNAGKTGATASTGAAKPAGAAKKVAANAPSAESPTTAEPAKPTPVDPSSITPGLDRKELLAKTGKPSMSITNTDGVDVVEKLWFKSAGRETIIVTLRNGKVAAVLP